ncbi:MAG: nucleotide exchange factor GrpE [Actinobacteria bacterium]|nr:nucleotide exchange factor GrpE [Actinomycetota bacterium]
MTDTSANADSRGGPRPSAAPPQDRDLPRPVDDATAAPEPDAVAARLEEQLTRALADLDNLRKRYARELARERADERARTAAEWLPVVDNLELALQHADAADRALVEGIRAVREQALAVLERLGFPRFDDIGRAFDPMRDEAVSTVEADAPERTIVAAVRPGYGTDESILRPAGVVVARSPE